MLKSIQLYRSSILKKIYMHILQKAYYRIRSLHPILARKSATPFAKLHILLQRLMGLLLPNGCGVWALMVMLHRNPFLLPCMTSVALVGMLILLCRELLGWGGLFVLVSKSSNKAYVSILVVAPGSISGRMFGSGFFPRRSISLSLLHIISSWCICFLLFCYCGWGYHVGYSLSKDLLDQETEDFASIHHLLRNTHIFLSRRILESGGLMIVVFSLWNLV